MKRIVLFFAVLLICSTACKKKVDKDDTNEDTKVTLSKISDDSGETGNFEKADDCSEFLDQYEEWTDEYASFWEEYKDNPTGAIADKRYTELLSKATSWSSNWVNLATSCAGYKKYDERFNEISDKMEKRMEGMGLK